MSLDILFPHLRDFRLLSYSRETTRLVLTCEQVTQSALCPQCGTAAHRIHSRYERTVWDLSIQNVQVLCRLGLKVGGQAGADTGQEQGLSGSRDTILRLVRRFPQPAESSPRIIGLDDWGATRKVACVAVRTPERRILPGVLPPVPYQAESSAPGTM